MEAFHDQISSHSEIDEPSRSYIRNKEIPTFFGQQLLKGTIYNLEGEHITPEKPVLYYSHPHGEIWVGDAIAWLRSLESESVDMIFADPPYNIQKAAWDTFESQAVYVEWSLQWIAEAARVLKPTGTLYICGFSEIIADLRLPASRFFKGCRWLI